MEFRFGLTAWGFALDDRQGDELWRLEVRVAESGFATLPDSCLLNRFAI